MDTHNITNIKSGVQILNREQKNEALYIRPHSPTVRACGFEPQYVSSILAGAAKKRQVQQFLFKRTNKSKENNINFIKFIKSCLAYQIPFPNLNPLPIYRKGIFFDFKKNKCYNIYNEKI